MADDTTYYTSKLTGERVSPASILAEELNALKEKVESGESSLTDANVGSEIRNLLESMANSQYQYRYELDRLSLMYLIRYAEGGWLDDIAWQYGLTRKKGTRASGYCVFTVSTPLTTDFTIPEGTCVLNHKTGNAYYLNVDVTIPAGSIDTTGLCISEYIGSAYNCDAYTITVFDTEYLLRNDLTVTNLQPFENGEDEETDDEFRTRILDYIRGGKFGSIEYYKSLCESIDDVHDVNFVAPEVLNNIETGRHTITINGNATECNDCTGVCVVNFHAKDDIRDDLLMQIESILTNQDNLIFGHEFHVQEAYNCPFYFKLDYYSENNVNVSEEEVFTCLTKFFFGGTYEGDVTISYTGCDIGGTVYKSDIINALENISGLHHVEQLTLLGWHKDMETVEQLSKFYDDQGVTDFVYESIVDYPDEDDPKFSVAKNPTLPCWKLLTDTTLEAEEGDKVYQLSIDDYFFYKVKDNSHTDYKDTFDDQLAYERTLNAGEHALNSEQVDFWEWGQKKFNKLVMQPDVVCYNGSLSSRQTTLNSNNDSKNEPNPHLLWLRDISEA